MEELLSKIASRLNDGDIYVAWSGVFFDKRHRYIRADKLYLNIVKKEDGVCTYRRCVRRVQRKPSAEPFILYDTNSVLYKITSGKRKGLIVFIDEIKDHEQWTYAGSFKELAIDRKAGFWPTRDSDKVTALLLESLPDFMETAEEQPLYEALPSLYLTCNSNTREVYLRRSGAALRFVMDHPAYNDKMSPEENLDRLRSDLCSEAGADRVAFPYKHIYGRGTVGAAVSGEGASIGTWYKVKNLKADEVGIQVI